MLMQSLKPRADNIYIELIQNLQIVIAVKTTAILIE